MWMRKASSIYSAAIHYSHGWLNLHRLPRPFLKPRLNLPEYWITSVPWQRIVAWKYYVRFTIGSKHIKAGTITWPVQSAMTMEEIVFKASFVQQLLFLEVALRLKVDGTLTVALTWPHIKKNFWWGQEYIDLFLMEVRRIHVGMHVSIHMGMCTHISRLFQVLFFQ